MKNLVNRVQLIGNLGMDPELKTVGQGNNLVKFTLATNEYFLNKEREKVTETTWHNLIAWGPLAERLAAILQKGMEVAVSGKIRNRSYDDKEGTRKYISEVVVDDFYRITRGQKSESLQVVEEPAKLPF
ncbi:MAG: single-stranded DNA-binding protein [Saprospiraceae bacterium]|jgi:single-strand DNA-binding protein|nr:single-stranded DNA-binding protein [Saprospiraceae bacterium]